LFYRVHGNTIHKSFKEATQLSIQRKEDEKWYRCTMES
jgi:hypothetical protein